jgi:4'-phosphopantetheinyl transferase EntD
MHDGAITASRLLGALFESPVIAFESRGRMSAEALLPEEAACVARAASKRVSEFAAGRACARRALAELEIVDFPLRMGVDREPLWPAHVTGSITHTGDYCGVVVARTSIVASLGVDAEQRDAVRSELWRHIATPEERATLASLSDVQARERATLLFSAKESFFKCQYPLTREWLNFNDVSVSVEDGRFAVRPCASLALEALREPPWEGRFAVEDALIVTGIGLGPVNTT